MLDDFVYLSFLLPSPFLILCIILENKESSLATSPPYFEDGTIILAMIDEWTDP